MKTILKKIYINLRNYRSKKAFFSRQKNSYGLDAKKIKYANKLGFTADEYVWYELDKRDHKEYISEWERMQQRCKSAKFSYIMDNKILFSLLIDKVAPRYSNKIYAYKMNGVFNKLIDGFNQEDIISRIKDFGKVVFKLESGPGGGVGFHLLEYKNNVFYSNKQKIQASDIQKMLTDSDNYLIEEYCIQNEFENSLCPSSVNTVRVVTVVENGVVNILHAVHRMGSNLDSCVDNACSGGLYASIDISTGIMGEAFSDFPKYCINQDGSRIRQKIHPVTHTPIAGNIIPKWNEIVDAIKDLHTRLLFTGIPFIAWDLALTTDLFKVIEGNTSCGYQLVQFEKGVRNEHYGTWLRDNGFL